MLFINVNIGGEFSPEYGFTIINNSKADNSTEKIDKLCKLNEDTQLIIVNIVKIINSILISSKIFQSCELVYKEIRDGFYRLELTFIKNGNNILHYKISKLPNSTYNTCAWIEEIDITSQVDELIFSFIKNILSINSILSLNSIFPNQKIKNIYHSPDKYSPPHNTFAIKFKDIFNIKFN